MTMRTPLSSEDAARLRKDLELVIAGLDALKDQIIITDKNANIIYANKATEQQNGYAPDEIIGKNPGDLWGGRMSQEFYEKMWHSIKTDKQPFVAEIENVRKDGTKHWQRIQVFPILDEAGEVRYFMSIEPELKTPPSPGGRTA